LKPFGNISLARATISVAFTPKGGCPLKHIVIVCSNSLNLATSSIHPQGWVPIETQKRQS